MSREADSILSTPPPASPASTGNLPGILSGLNAASYFNRPGVSCLMGRILSLLERCLRDNKHQGYAAFFQPSIHSFRLYLETRQSLLQKAEEEMSATVHKIVGNLASIAKDFPM